MTRIHLLRIRRPHKFAGTERRASVRAAVALLVGCAAWVISAPGVAAPLSVVIDVERTPAAVDCVDGSKLLAKVEGITQRPLAADAQNANVIHVAVHFDRVGGEYHAELTFLGPKPGERRLSDPGNHCEPLADAAAVAIALLLDREIERRERDVTDRLRAEPTISITRAEVEPRRVHTNALAATVEAGVLAGFNAAVTGAVGIGFGLTPSAGWLLESNAWATVPASTSFGMGQVDVSLVAGSLGGCRLWGNVWQWGPCAGIAVGRLHGEGRGFDESFSSNLSWWALGASFLIKRPIGQNWDLGVQAAAWGLPEQRRFAVQNAGTAWNSPRIMPGLSVRLGFRFD